MATIFTMTEVVRAKRNYKKKTPKMRCAFLLLLLFYLFFPQLFESQGKNNQELGRTPQGTSMTRDSIYSDTESS